MPPPGGDGDSVPDVLGALSVPIDNHDSHNYAVEMPCMSRGSECLHLKVDGVKGNHLPLREHLRAPTPEEIETFIRDMNVAAVSDHLGTLLKVVEAL